MTGLEFSNPDTQCMVYLPLLIYVLVVLGVTVGQTPAPLSVWAVKKRFFFTFKKQLADFESGNLSFFHEAQSVLVFKTQPMGGWMHLIYMCVSVHVGHNPDRHAVQMIDDKPGRRCRIHPEMSPYPLVAMAPNVRGHIA